MLVLWLISGYIIISLQLLFHILRLVRSLTEFTLLCIIDIIILSHKFL